MTVSAIQFAASAADWRIIPLNKLFLGEGNVRKIRRKAETTDGLTGMQSSILSQDLLQNLVVVERPEGFEVFAGGERLINMQGLADMGKITADHSVMCRVVPEEIALNASLTENVMRTPMHPADEFDAFKGLIEEGRSIEDVAATFGVTPAVVTRRLKLANVSPKLVAEFRADRASLEQLMALTLAHTHERQEAIYFGLPEDRRYANVLRQQATVDEVNIEQDALGRFIGLEAYEAAGGALRKDLFSTATYITDMALLDRLAAEKLAITAAEVEAEGWGWVEVIPRKGYDATYSYDRIYKVSRTPTAEEAAEVERLNAECIRLDNAIEEAETNGDGDSADQLTEQRNALDEQIESISDSLNAYAPEDRAIAGVILGVSPSGTLDISRALIKKGMRRDTPNNTPNSTEPEAPRLSARMGRQLSAHQNAALQVELARKPSVALAISLHGTVLTALQKVYGESYRLPVGVNMSRYTSLDDEAPDYAGSAAAMALEAMKETWAKRLPSDSAKLLRALLKLKMEELVELFALCAALHLDVVRDKASDGKSPTDELARVLKLDMRTYWQPTAEGYFKHVTKPLALEAVKEFAPDQVERLSTMKRAELATEAERLAVGTGWLPPLLKSHE